MVFKRYNNNNNVCNLNKENFYTRIILRVFTL